MHHPDMKTKTLCIIYCLIRLHDLRGKQTVILTQQQLGEGKKAECEKEKRDTGGDGELERRETEGETASQTEDYHGIPPREQSCS